MKDFVINLFFPIVFGFLHRLCCDPLCVLSRLCFTSFFCLLFSHRILLLSAAFLFTAFGFLPLLFALQFLLFGVGALRRLRL